MEKKLWLGILIGILVSVIVVLSGFIFYNQFLKDNSVNVQEESEDNLDDSNQVEEGNKFTSVDVNSQIVSSAMGLLLNKNNSSLSSSCFIQYDIYSNYAEKKYSGKISMTDFDNDDILQLIYENIPLNSKPSSIESNSEYYISEDTFNIYARKIFGDNYVIPESGYSGCDIKISHDSGQKRYNIMEALGGDESIVTATNTYMSAKMNNDTLVVVEKVQFSFPDIATDEIKQNYSNDLILEYTFKKSSSNNYYFYSIEKK